MRADQWESCWNIIRGSWPGSPSLADEVVKIEWASAFGDSNPRWLMEAVRMAAKRNDRPTVKGLADAYEEVLERKREGERLARLTSGPVASDTGVVPMPSYDAEYLALDPDYRAEIEEKIKARYPGAYAGRNDDPMLKWAWRCLVVTCEAKGIDPVTGGFVGSTALVDLEAWEANYGLNLEATRKQLLHEQSCPKCAAYAAPPSVATKANPLRDRVGSPCPVGLRYWGPHYAEGMPRPGLGSESGRREWVP